MKFKNISRYKYLLTEDISVITEIFPEFNIQEPEENPYITLTKHGILTVHSGYAWDGASGIAIDTHDFMRASLFHDALYQLMRQGRLPISAREQADDLMYRICREDGMSEFRAEYCRKAVRLFGESSAERILEKEQETIEI